jgi:N-methylhydantoinase A/oxoprolinase/acetone carboxylase beta subunit
VRLLSWVTKLPPRAAGTCGKGHPLLLAVDIGGTFAALVAADVATGRVRSRGRIRPLGGVDHGVLAALRRSEVRLANLSTSGYGTTVVINAVTERTARRPPGFPRGNFDMLEMVRLNWPGRCLSSPQIVAVPKSTAV